MIAIRHQGDDTMRTTFTRAAVAAGLLGCAIGITVGVAFAGTGDAALKIDDFSFTPKSMTVKAGTTVTWTNQDDIPHTVTSTTTDPTRSIPTISSPSRFRHRAPTIIFAPCIRK
jgi:plastocyanin